MVCPGSSRTPTSSTCTRGRIILLVFSVIWFYAYSSGILAYSKPIILPSRPRRRADLDPSTPIPYPPETIDALTNEREIDLLQQIVPVPGFNRPDAGPYTTSLPPHLVHKLLDVYPTRRQPSLAPMNRYGNGFGLSGINFVNQTRPDGVRDKLILYYTKLFDEEVPYSYADLDKCEIPWCKYTTDKELLMQADVIWMHGRDISSTEWTLVDSYKTNNQLVVWMAGESQYYGGNKERVPDWTVTSSSKASIFSPWAAYRKALPREMWTDTRLNELLARKKKFENSSPDLAIWIASHCHPKTSVRYSYVQEMSKYIGVKQMGACSGEICPRTNCTQAIIPQYRFFLSFENSNCDGYITEKYWQNALTTTAIPVVMGGGNYEQDGIPGSFINVRDYDSPQALALYLKRVAQDDELFLSYHQWRKKYVHYTVNRICDVCKAAHLPPNEQPPRLSTQELTLDDVYGAQMCSTKEQEQQELLSDIP